MLQVRGGRRAPVQGHHVRLRPLHAALPAAYASQPSSANPHCPPDGHRQLLAPRGTSLQELQAVKGGAGKGGAARAAGLSQRGAHGGPGVGPDCLVGGRGQHHFDDGAGGIGGAKHVGVQLACVHSQAARIAAAVGQRERARGRSVLQGQRGQAANLTCSGRGRHAGRRLAPSAAHARRKRTCCFTAVARAAKSARACSAVSHWSPSLVKEALPRGSDWP